MMVLVSYDVMVTSPGGPGRLRKVAKACTNYGQRVQHSVFECVIDPAQWVQLKNILEKIIDDKKDSLRYYYLGANYKRRVEHVGAKPSYDVDSPLIV
ncbi:CRISPR-associated endoribonuclease Cas2 [Spirochaetia bacterium]|nr:CRISPR-associated endoribonuclease Cas2 [Spirochaetia bacterium]GHV62022.1 CRISPR-associated endoribonuclease Cas2 [Spirochaetia bacterium]